MKDSLTYTHGKQHAAHKNKDKSHRTITMDADKASYTI